MKEDYIKAGKAWLGESDSRLGRAMKLAGKPVAAAMEALPSNAQDRVGRALTASFNAIINGSERTTDLESIQRKTREAVEAAANTEEDAAARRTADVAVRSQLVTSYRRKTTSGAFGGGVLTGMAGLPGLLVDIPVLMGLQARIGQQAAAVYGFDPVSSSERLLLLRLLEVAECFGDDRKQLVSDMLFASAVTRSEVVREKMSRLTAALTTRGMAPAAVQGALQRTVTRQVSRFVTQRASQVTTTISIGTRAVALLVDGGTLTEAVARGVIKSQSKRVGQWMAERAAADYAEKLLARKMLAAVPIFGGVIGGSFNAWFTNRNAEAAEHFYRIRYICETYGAYGEFGLAAPDVEAAAAAVDALSVDEVGA